MLRAMDSFDGSLGLYSALSPIKNPSLGTVDTVSSLQYSALTSGQNLLKLRMCDTAEKTANSFCFTDRSEQWSTKAKLDQLLRLQKLVQQGYGIYVQQANRIRERDRKIEELRRCSQKKKQEALCLKDMAEFYGRKYRDRKRHIEGRERRAEQHTIMLIEKSRRKTSSLYEEVKQLKRSLRSLRKNRIQLRTEQNYPYYPMPQYYEQPYPYPTNMPDQFHPLHPSYASGASHNTPQAMLSSRNTEKEVDPNSRKLFESEGIADALYELVRKDYLESLTKKAVQADIQELKNSNKCSATWENQHEERELIEEIKQSQKGSEVAPEGHRQLTKTKSNLYLLSQKNSSVVSLHPPVAKMIIESPMKKNLQPNNYHEYTRNMYMEESLASGLTTNQLKPRNNTQGFKDSALRIDMNSDEFRSGENSVVDQNIKTNRDRSGSAQLKINSNSSSFEKVFVEESEVLKKTQKQPPMVQMPVPGKQRRLRKVTEQQSDLFDSRRLLETLSPKEGKKIEQVSECNVFGQENLGHSEALQKTISYSDNPQSSAIKKTTQQKEEEEFMNIKLATISKNSKSKYSEKSLGESAEGKKEENKMSEQRTSRYGQNSKIYRSSQPMAAIKQEARTNKTANKYASQVKNYSQSSEL